MTFGSTSITDGTSFLVVMGVSGSGKTTIAQALALRLGWPIKESDTFHSEANVAKMHGGIPLTDADRQPWLEAVAEWIDRRRAEGQPGIVTCSALKRNYRRVIIGSRPDVRLVYLRGKHAVIAERLASRKGHFMPPRLLQSQLDTLEEPGDDEQPLVVDIGQAAALITEQIIGRLAGSAVRA